MFVQAANEYADSDFRTPRVDTKGIVYFVQLFKNHVYPRNDKLYNILYSAIHVIENLKGKQQKKITKIAPSAYYSDIIIYYNLFCGF